MVILPKNIRGLTLLMEPPDDVNRVEPHLYIILTNIFEGQLLLVNITKTLGRSVDEACILQPREHNFIMHESFVFYKKSSLLDEAEFKEKFENNKRLGPLNKTAFQRVCDGLYESKYTREKIKNFYKRYIESLPPR